VQAYTACAVVDEDGQDRCPTWRITADRVTYDPTGNKLRFRGAFFELFGQRLLPLPGLSLSTDGGAASGFFVPDLRITRNNGVEVSGSYYWKLAPNRDLTASAYLFTEAPPMVSGQWRHLTDLGAYQVTGYLTGSRRIDVASGELNSEDSLRGYLFANGRFQLDPNWSITGSIRRASDRTFLRRYDISREDRLRSVVEVERIDEESYFSLAGWATQTLRLNASQGQQPIALPVLDYRRRLDDPLLGGTAELQLNTLAIGRTAGQDTQRPSPRRPGTGGSHAVRAGGDADSDGPGRCVPHRQRPAYGNAALPRRRRLAGPRHRIGGCRRGVAADRSRLSAGHRC
jgi:LPS-assembly protein